MGDHTFPHIPQNNNPLQAILTRSNADLSHDDALMHEYDIDT